MEMNERELTRLRQDSDCFLLGGKDAGDVGRLDEGCL
jgi:hypothetical protein